MNENAKNQLSKTQRLAEVEELRRQLEEARQTLEAIRCGEVDALAGPAQRRLVLRAVGVAQRKNRGLHPGGYRPSPFQQAITPVHTRT